MSNFNAIASKNPVSALQGMGPYSQTVAFSHYNNLAAQLPIDPKSADIHLMFYDEAEDQSLSNELEFMEKWVAIIQARIKGK